MSDDNKYHEKTAAEAAPYSINWATLLAAEDDGDGDTISTSSWTVSPTGLILSNDSVDNVDTRAVIKISGGDDGVKYTVINTIVTNNGSTFEDFLEITVRNYG